MAHNTHFIDQYKSNLEEDYYNSQKMFMNRRENAINIGLYEDPDCHNIYRIKIRMEEFLINCKKTENNIPIYFLCFPNDFSIIPNNTLDLKEFILTSYDGHFLYTVNGDKKTLINIVMLNLYKIIKLLGST